MTSTDQFTGERFIPGVVGEIAYEHCHRYAFAGRFAHGMRVLDAACGEGYGSALLAEVAAFVVGVDIDAGVVAAARQSYGPGRRVSFEAASVTQLPLADASVDAVVSFETVEHLPAEDQRQMLAEFARVLTPGGVLVLSSPNRPEYSDARGYTNPFHVHELDRSELAALLQPHFPAQQWFCQRRYLGSSIWSEIGGERFEAMSGSASRVEPAKVPPALYFVVVAARTVDSLPSQAAALSLYADGDDAEWKRVDHEAREVLRLDGLLRERDDELRRYVRHSHELEAIVAARDEAIARADAAMRQEAGLHTAERDRLQREIDAQERLVAYRESARWWLMLPWLRVRRAWKRVRVE